MQKTTKTFWMGILTGVFLMVVFVSGAVVDRLWKLPLLEQLARTESTGLTERFNQRILTEENVVTEVAERVSPSVVTVSLVQEQQVMEQYFLDPFGMFRGQRPSGETETLERDIGTGFVVDSSGLVVTNKHVVSQGFADNYKVIMKDDTEYQVQNIWRDPVNDLAILKIEQGSYPAIEMGDSDQLKVGNFVIAIGTALGEFRHTVTTGVVSGLGRGITAGGASFAEELSNVIQTDAAINPGNSGGPLLNSAGQVIGVNVAVSAVAENIGFALPINVVKESLNTFNSTGRFDRAFFGVRYQDIDMETALMNDVPAGAWVREVVEGSSADRAGIEVGDILVKWDEQKIVDTEGGLASLVTGKRIGDRVEVEYYRDGETRKVMVELFGESNEVIK